MSPLPNLFCQLQIWYESFIFHELDHPSSSNITTYASNHVQLMMPSHVTYTTVLPDLTIQYTNTILSTCTHSHANYTQHSFIDTMHISTHSQALPASRCFQFPPRLPCLGATSVSGCQTATFEFAKSTNDSHSHAMPCYVWSPMVNTVKLGTCPVPSPASTSIT